MANPIEQNKHQRISKDEAEQLSDYLDLGLSISDAREVYKREIELAEMKKRIRDNKRAANRGAISSTRSQTTRIGPLGTSSYRGGLSFN